MSPKILLYPPKFLNFWIEVEGKHREREREDIWDLESATESTICISL
jgi:hypothetical protein